jgi:APA family basic amino acid/polyamine antiporter
MADETPGPVPAPESRLRRELGLLEVTASGVGIIVGAGIYVLVGAATTEAGSAVWIAFILGGLLGLITGLSYAELTSMYPSAAGEFEYTRHAFPEWLAFAVGWVMIAGLVVAAAAIALGFAQYLERFVDIDRRIAAIGLLWAVTMIALAGIKHSARVTVLLSLVQVGGLVAVVIAGIPEIGSRDLVQDVGAAGVLGATALVFFAFIGFDEVITLAEETRNPRRTVPLALLLGLGISTTLYVAVSIATVSVLGAEALGASDQPLAAVMTEAIGSAGGDVIAIVALVTTTNTTLLCLTAASRLVFGMATGGVFPPLFSSVSSRTGAPSRAVVVCALIASGFALVGGIKLVASVTDVAVYAVFAAVNLTVIVLRFRQPAASRPFRVSGSIGRVPVTAVLGIVSVVALTTRLEPTALVLGGLLCASGVPAARLAAHMRARALRRSA